MGGDHKCPLCAATFTRPQHVGRHLRAHTGDRPYECKECPLRFARSDLLSRHVSKAHPKANGASDKNDKKPRRKGGVSQQPQPAAMKPHALPPPPSPSGPAVPALPSAAVVIPAPPEPTAYQAQRMYPNHPLLQQNAGSWASTGYELGSQHYAAPLGDSQLGGVDNANLEQVGIDAGASYSHSPYASTAMRLSGSDQGGNGMTFASNDFATSLPNNFSGHHVSGFEPFVKKRACDQCNHSKVRCDFAEPCARCSHRSVTCTYSKPQRVRATLSMAERTPVMGDGGQAAPTAFVSGYQNQGATQAVGDYSDRRNSATQNTFLTSDALLHSDAEVGGGFRHSGVEPNWATSHAPANPHGLQIMTNMNGSSNSLLNQSPMNMSMALTPTLTHSTSPTASDSTGRRPSTTSSYNHWSLPVGADYSAMQTHGDGKDQPDAVGNAQMLWPGLLDSSTTSSNSTVAISEDEDTPPTTMSDYKGGPPRRRSSAGMWANAFNQMRLDDASQQNLMLDANGQLQFPFLRHGTSPFERPGLHSRQPTNQDVNMWKFFLDPTALATPEQRLDAELSLAQHTPGPLSKSSSMPDLTTPPTDNAAPSPSMDATGQYQPPQNSNMPTSGTVRHYAADDGTVDRWKTQIQRRQASFSIHLSPEKSRKIRTQAIANASFASSVVGRPVRPLPSALIPSGSLDQTLAPERLPSFGTPLYDPSTPMPSHPGYGQLGHSPLTPKARNGSTAAKLTKQFMDRPVNKRQASQTLMPEGPKRVSA